jgi:hypothetical protein
LLGTGQFDTKKHEIKLDREGKLSVTDVVSSEFSLLVDESAPSGSGTAIRAPSPRQ